MPAVSAGLLLYRRKNGRLEFLLAHNGGPFFKNKDKGFWTIPKGMIEENEDELTAAKREFKEETGHEAPDGDYQPIGTVKQKNNKIVHAWAVEADFDASKIKSNTFETEWPPRSGRMQTFPEMDRVGWFSASQAKEKANEAQRAFIDRVIELLGGNTGEAEQTSLL